ncbi:MAG: hypothetical protein PHR36_00260 [Patescibacteria group bacterium]|nr:hypothetical protein [Patescibacteria group bacterium]
MKKLLLCSHAVAVITVIALTVGISTLTKGTGDNGQRLAIMLAVAMATAAVTPVLFRIGKYPVMALGLGGLVFITATLGATSMITIMFNATLTFVCAAVVIDEAARLDAAFRELCGKFDQNKVVRTVIAILAIILNLATIYYGPIIL